MTEEEWLACADPAPILMLLGGAARDRKLRLFCCACCRRIWESLPTEGREAVEVSERFADGLVLSTEVQAAFERLEGIAQERGRPWAPDTLTYAISSAGDASAPHATTVPMAVSAASTASKAAGCAAGDAVPDEEYDRAYYAAERQEASEQARLVREVFGNPFRLVAFNPAWRTTDVTLLAKGIYDEKAFDRMPILADALQEAGCDNEDILNHLRDSNATHVRGCWALDLVLGKE
jgi:hypothetical protein